MDAIWAKKTADSFWSAAARSMEQWRLNTTQFEMLIIPGVVCTVFSIELGIKAILLSEGASPKTHNLAGLFSLLPETIQDQIVTSCGEPRDAFDASLTEIADVFDGWRYLYETESVNLDHVFLNSLTDAVKVAADALVPIPHQVIDPQEEDLIAPQQIAPSSL